MPTRGLPAFDTHLRLKKLLAIRGEHGADGFFNPPAVEGCDEAYDRVRHEQEKVRGDLEVAHPAQRDARARDGHVPQVLHHVRLEGAGPVVVAAPQVKDESQRVHLHTGLLPVLEVSAVLELAAGDEEQEAPAASMGQTEYGSVSMGLIFRCIRPRTKKSTVAPAPPA